MATPINVRCPSCSGIMLVDPHYLSTKTNCPHCSADLLPASHVHLAPIVQPLPINNRPFNFDEDDEPTRRVKRHRIEGSFGTGFGFGFGSALGEMLAGALATIVALVLLAFWVFSWK